MSSNVSLGKVKRNKISRIRKYIITYNNLSYKISFIKYYDNLYPLQVRIYYPNTDIINAIHTVLSPYDYFISNVEYTMDFYTSFIVELYRAITLTYRLKYSGRGKQVPEVYDTSIYVGNPRQTQSKGSRIYICGDNADGHVRRRDNYVRLEFVAKRRLLKDHGLHQIPKLLKSNNILLQKFIQFQTLDIDKLYRYYRKRLSQKVISKEFILNIKSKLNALQTYGHSRIIDKALSNTISDTFFLPHPYQDYFNGIISSIDFAGKISVSFDGALLMDPEYLYKLV